MIHAEDKEGSSKPVAHQFAASALGELTAVSIAIGAVYASERLLPKQHSALLSHLAESLGKGRGASADSQRQLAKKILDVGVMNIAGASSMAVQFGVRRAQQKPEERKSLWYEAGRLAFGRIAGTITALGALSFMGSRAPGVLNAMETGFSKTLGGTAHSHRFAELLLSNAVQSVGAVAGNAPAQLLYDCLVDAGPEKEKGR